MGLADDPKGPRQRMINMMYLVFIAMLALNMSKEVLQAFGDVNNSLEANTKQTVKRNSELLAGLADKAQEQPEKYGVLKQQADKIEQAGDDLVDYINKLKKDLVVGIERTEDGELKYKNMDRAETLNQMFFANDKLTKRAKEFVSKIDTFRESALVAANNEMLKNDINAKFDTSPIKVKDGGKRPWVNNEFEGFPLIASITKMTNIQANAKQTESEILSSLFQGQLKSDVSLSNYKAIIIPDKAAFFSNENFKGKVVLGRFDKNMNFKKVIVNGKEATNIKNGQVMLDFPAGSVGDKDITGEIKYMENGEEKSIDIKDYQYSVIPMPNSAVISADKMNVVYRGVDNPLTISIPGVPSVSANAPGMRGVGGAKYMLNPTNIKAAEVNINVSGKLPNGTSITKSKKFRIKEIPSPIGTVRGQDGTVRMQRNGLKISTISAKIPDFDFKVTLVVSGFKMQIPGQPIVDVKGTKLNAQAKRYLSAAKRGSTITIFDIKASLSGSSYHLPKVYPIVVQLTN